MQRRFTPIDDQRITRAIRLGQDLGKVAGELGLTADQCRDRFQYLHDHDRVEDAFRYQRAGYFKAWRASHGLPPATYGQQYDYISRGAK